MFKINDVIRYENEDWRIVGIGAKEEYHTFLHLASTTRFRMQRNGPVPVQKAVWVLNQD